MPGFADLTSVMFGTVFSTFGEPVTLIQDDKSCTLTGIFKADAAGIAGAVDASAGVPVSTVQPVLELREADLTFEVEEGDAVVATCDSVSSGSGDTASRTCARTVTEP